MGISEFTLAVAVIYMLRLVSVSMTPNDPVLPFSLKRSLPIRE